MAKKKSKPPLKLRNAVNTQVRIGEIQLVPVVKLETMINPRNRNEHPQEQIDELVEQYKYQGVRQPIIISKRSGLIVAGHGRLLAAQKVGLKYFPASLQDFDNEDQEYAFAIADNAIQSWSTLDMQAINSDLEDLDGMEFDIGRLAIQGFELDPKFDPGSEDEQGKLDEKKKIQCPKCRHKFTP